ncbi:MAG: flagellar basal body P-ring formation chaperone FlgA [Pseudomonadota bacterium]
MNRLLAILAMVISQPVLADILVPSRTIRAKEIINAEDLMAKAVSVAGAVSDPALLIGQEARTALYAGRPIRSGDVGPPSMIERNDLVVLVFGNGALTISTDGRALGRGSVGEAIRVMNLASRTTLTGRIRPDGTIEVTK